MHRQTPQQFGNRQGGFALAANRLSRLFARFVSRRERIIDAARFLQISAAMAVVRCWLCGCATLP
jgi:hypothetical protein